MCRQRNKQSSTTNNQGNKVTQKGNEILQKLNSKSRKTVNYSFDKEFKIGVMKKLNDVQKHSERQFNELKKKINEQKWYFTKELETKLEPNRNSRAEELNI